MVLFVRRAVAQIHPETCRYPETPHLKVEIALPAVPTVMKLTVTRERGDDGLDADVPPLPEPRPHFVIGTPIKSSQQNEVQMPTLTFDETHYPFEGVDIIVVRPAQPLFDFEIPRPRSSLHSQRRSTTD